MTIMTAQIAEGRKGRRIQKLAAVNPPIATTAKRTRVTSQRTVVSAMAWLS